MTTTYKNLAPEERLIVALDFDNREDALRLTDQLEGVVSFYKVGFELFISEGLSLVEELRARGNRVFLDLKINDVDETVRRAVAAVVRRDCVDFMTLYGGPAAVAAAKRGKGESNVQLLQVTLLTSLGQSDLDDLDIIGEGKTFATVNDYVLWRARQAFDQGCDGFISSGQNVGLLREEFRDGPLIVCPGIRPRGAAIDEHKRASTPYDAIHDGSDFLVVGRPIRDANSPQDAAKRIAEDIGKGLADSA